MLMLILKKLLLLVVTYLRIQTQEFYYISNTIVHLLYGQVSVHVGVTIQIMIYVSE